MTPPTAIDGFCKNCRTYARVDPDTGLCRECFIATAKELGRKLKELSARYALDALARYARPRMVERQAGPLWDVLTHGHGALARKQRRKVKVG